MESDRSLYRTLIATAAAAGLLLGACTEPKEGAPNTNTAQHEETLAAQQIETTLLNDLAEGSRVAPAIPTTEESVHVRPGEYAVSGPYTHENLEVFLVHSRAQRKHPRPILTLAEALKQKKVKVHETGNVSELAIENLTHDADIYVQAGDIVQGGKQDRVLAIDLLVQPKSGKMPIASFCVEQGRWGSRGQVSGQAFGAESMLPTLQFMASSNSIISKDLKKAVKLANDQSEVWRNVSVAQDKLSKNVGVDARSTVSESSLELTLNNEKVQKAAGKFERELGRIAEGKDDVVGFAFAINGAMNSAEIYASNTLFRKLWGKMLQATAVEAVSEADAKPSGTRPKPLTQTAVQAFLAVQKNDRAKGQTINERVQLVTVDGESIVFTETRDREANSAWVHRSYFVK